MGEFSLDPRLQRDCHTLGELGGELGGERGENLLLLMDNSLLPWFVIVPKENVTEIYELTHEKQLEILDLINKMSVFVNEHFNIDKLNIAAIGNIVSQLHIHLVGRRRDDYCWPGVVWGVAQKEAYIKEEVSRIKTLLIANVSKFNPV